MYETNKIKEKKYPILMLISIVIVVTFIIGFIFGGSFMYGLASYEIDDLQYQMSLLSPDNSVIEIYNSTYYYNDSSLSDLELVVIIWYE